jgi:hypothetical protein
MSLKYYKDRLARRQKERDKLKDTDFEIPDKTVDQQWNLTEPEHSSRARLSGESNHPV